ncbi:MAG: hypothetical protein J5621_07515, partial [Paludibacteraceae bacterium]|nr:hypothetical protein [Paludibacteraceae bacterium]
MPIPNNPITRTEQYLAKIAGQNVPVPDYPITREESYLDYIAKHGGGGGGAFWGAISGTLNEQTDLQGALDDKFDADETTIIEPTNLFDISQGLTNYKPNTTSGSKYSEGSTM